MISAPSDDQEAIAAGTPSDAASSAEVDRHTDPAMAAQDLPC